MAETPVASSRPEELRARSSFGITEYCSSYRYVDGETGMNEPSIPVHACTAKSCVQQRNDAAFVDTDRHIDALEEGAGDQEQNKCSHQMNSSIAHLRLITQ